MKKITEMSEGAKLYVKKPIPIQAVQIFEPFEVVTLEGTMRGNTGDWLIKGIEGELYPCMRSIFEKSYKEI